MAVDGPIRANLGSIFPSTAVEAEAKVEGGQFYRNESFEHE